MSSTIIIVVTGMNQPIPRRANFRNVGKAWILEEVSKRYDTWEPFIQYLKFDDPDMDKAIRFGYYKVENGKRTKMLGNMFFELSVLAELKEQIEKTKSHAIKYLLKEIFG